MKRYDKRMADAWDQCRRFNDGCPVGSRVQYRPIRDSDEGMIETVTRSEAWALPSAQPVVMVVQRAGGVSIDHITVLRPALSEA